MLTASPGVDLLELLATGRSDTGVEPILDLVELLATSRPAWHADALCQEHSEVNFFPGLGEDVRPAKQVCAACLVKVECRSWALEQGAGLDGIWAGTSSRQRGQMRATAARQAVAAA